jgi:hypothetical protein
MPKFNRLLFSSVGQESHHSVCVRRAKGDGEPSARPAHGAGERCLVDDVEAFRRLQVCNRDSTVLRAGSGVLQEHTGILTDNYRDKDMYVR